MTIEDPKKFLAGLWDWAILDGCFGETRIRPTDIDGMATYIPSEPYNLSLVERHGYFLMFEAKSPGAPVKKGQDLMFRALTKSWFWIFVIWGNPGNPEQMFIYSPYVISEAPFPCDKAFLRHAASEWYRWVQDKAKMDRGKG